MLKMTYATYADLKASLAILGLTAYKYHVPSDSTHAAYLYVLIPIRGNVVHFFDASQSPILMTGDSYFIDSREAPSIDQF